jgi:beta-glucosidase
VVALSVLVLLVASVPTVVPPPPVDLTTAIFRDPSYSPAERAADLVSYLTLAEKASQMVSSQAPAIPRLGIRAYGWWNEAIHGVAREQTINRQNPPTLINTTSYPVSLSMGSTWNPDLTYRVASAISDEAREVVRDNTLDLNFYSPTVNLARDPRWGRNDETYSEDPYLTAALASQYVNGMEGKDQSGHLLPESGGYLKTTTTLKHYAANNSEFNRLNGSSDMDERTLREYYTAQFRAIVRQADPASVMTAYNAINGVPASVNLHLLETLGRETFGFDGFYTSDCDSIFEVQDGHAWKPPERQSPVDSVERNAFANAAGVDLNCQMGYHDEANYANSLPEAVHRGVATPLGRYTEADLDRSLVRLFTARFALGEFDDPQQVPWVTAARSRVPAGSWANSEANQAVTETPERLQLARAAAAESLVLLRNDGDLLPLRVPSTGPYRIAVVGAAARPNAMYLGGYSSTQGSAGAAHAVNGFDGIHNAVVAINPAATVDYVTDPTTVGSYDAVVVYAATDQTVADEGADRADLTLPDGQAELIRRVTDLNPRTVVYLETIGQVDLSALGPDVHTLLWSSYNGQRKGEALADVLFGRIDPSGHLPFTWYAGGGLPPIGNYAIRPGVSNPGRTYMYFPGPVAYAFGHGLSYTTFDYSPLRLDHDGVTADGTVSVSVDVTNSGAVAGAPVVQLYAVTPGAGGDRPYRRLAGFRKVMVQPGQTVTVDLTVKVADLAFFDEAAGRFEVDQGLYRLEVGASSGDIRQTATVNVTGDLTPVPVVVTAHPGAVVVTRGQAVDPRLTVAMNDDTLYGYRVEQPAQPLPAGLTVTYASNRPDVVAVDGGTIRAVAKGVATVTVGVSQGATTISTTFALAVR